MTEIEVNGHADEGFGKVVDAFRTNFAEHAELGAAFALRVGGELVVDIHAGVADKRSGRPWTADTLALVFSTTKGIAAICAARLVEGGRLDLATPVAAYWPEFAANGKEAVTVAQVLSHQAGLPTIDGRPTMEDVLAVQPMVDALAEQAPLWPPGTAHGYHAITYGWLVGELVRRVDGRRIGQYLQEEICEPLGVDCWIGLPESEEDRVSRLRGAPRPTGEDLEFMRKVAGPGTLGGRALTLNGALLAVGDDMAWNSRALHATEMPAANGITDARALATIYAATVGPVDGVRLLHPPTVDAFRAEQSNGPDECLVTTTRFGAGFMLDGPMAPMLGPGSFGHPGAGGSLGYADPEAGVGYGYVMNQMGGGIAGDPRTLTLNDAVRACL
jgi:CubicO group peptidase (beta-lactamase class C family)